MTFPFRGQGITIPTVAEVFSTFPAMRMVMEIKPAEPAIAESLCQMVRDFAMQEHVLVVSFHTEAIQSFRHTCPEVATATTQREVQIFWVLHRLYLGAIYQPPAQALLVPETFGPLRVVDERFLQEAQAHNMKVQVWTVNETASIQRLLRLRLQGLITDYPERVLTLLGRLPTTFTHQQQSER
jgi:glycerophosphoryl diester phosphodiesterase